MQERNLNVGDVVQLNPDHHMFLGMLVMVLKPMSIGCKGCVITPAYFKSRDFNSVHINAEFKEFEYVGHMHWTMAELSKKFSSKIR